MHCSCGKVRNNREAGLRLLMDDVFNRTIPLVKKTVEISDEATATLLRKQRYISAKMSAYYNWKWTLGFLGSVDEKSQVLLVDGMNKSKIRSVEVTSHPFDVESDIDNFINLVKSGQFD